MAVALSRPVDRHRTEICTTIPVAGENQLEVIRHARWELIRELVSGDMRRHRADAFGRRPDQTKPNVLDLCLSDLCLQRAPRERFQNDRAKPAMRRIGIHPRMPEQ